MDRKTAIQVLMGCAGKECVNATKTECPYAAWLGEYEDSYYECTTRLARDVLTLLKEQEEEEIDCTVFLGQAKTEE